MAAKPPEDLLSRTSRPGQKQNPRRGRRSMVERRRDTICLILGLTPTHAPFYRSRLVSRSSAPRRSVSNDSAALNERYFTNVGTLRLIVDPSPSCPFWLNPQQYVDPALVDPHT